MRKKAPALPPAILRDTARSPLFWPLYEHHDTLAETCRHRRANWRAVCAWAAEQQVPDRDGKPIKADAARADAARKTWERVCAVKAQERADREVKQRPAHVRSPRPASRPRWQVLRRTVRSRRRHKAVQAKDSILTNTSRSCGQPSRSVRAVAEREQTHECKEGSRSRP